MNHTKQQTRENNWKHALRKRRIAREVLKWEYYNNLDKNKYNKACDSALKKVLDVPVIFNADIGHVSPKMTIINGSIATITSNNGKGTITQELI